MGLESSEPDTLVRLEFDFTDATGRDWGGSKQDGNSSSGNQKNEFGQSGHCGLGSSGTERRIKKATVHGCIYIRGSLQVESKSEGIDEGDDRMRVGTIVTVRPTELAS